MFALAPPSREILASFGICDCFAIFTAGHFTGYFVAVGTVFCDYPLLIYCLGSFGNQSANTSFLLTFLLLLTRILDLAASKWKDFLFKENRALWSIGISIGFGVYLNLFGTPGLFNADFGSWIFDPMIPGLTNNQFEAKVQGIFNLIFCFSLGIFTPLTYLLQWRRERKYGQMVSYKKQVLQQAILVSVFPLLTATAYATLGLFASSPYFMLMMYISSNAWYAGHCLPLLQQNHS
ncbi:unnamed protein product, partial [Mesorhabditis belari]|uniref:Uncharacterized protein n=1 Tax=Mesorhabditis belari TaxID=2138241 RepID=A0AAF3F7D4_9BILA